MTTQQAAAVIYTIDVNKLARFYERLIGMSVIRTEQDYCVLSFGAFQLTVHAMPEHNMNDIATSSPPVAREHGAIKLSFPIDSLARARQVANELGGLIYGVEREWSYEGMTLCDGYDPDGNVIQLFETIER